MTDAFLFVRPTGTTDLDQVGAWAKSEMDRAVVQWRKHFRGYAPIKDDVDVTEEDIENRNLILWGDPTSNRLWSRIAKDLPITRVENEWHVGDRKFPVEATAPIMVYPNPLNPEKYIVTNSSFTFREYAYLNNARQVPMLPDWAIIDLAEPAGNVWPGRVVVADFFDEGWQVKLPIPAADRVDPPPVVSFGTELDPQK